MLYKIADLIAEVPTADGLAVRCADYAYGGTSGADIIIRPDFYRNWRYPANFPPESVAYMESGFQFYKALTKFQGLYLHSSAVIRDGRAYLFSGNSGVGKSTHTGLWLSTFGGDTRIINDDKPAMRCIDGVWYAYGTPWCGKDGINLNEKAPVAGVCFLKQGPENKIRRLSAQESAKNFLAQTIFKFEDLEQLDAFTQNLNKFLSMIPVFELENVPEPSAARLSYKTMLGAAPEL